jgi:hypothetical protein
MTRAGPARYRTVPSLRHAFYAVPWRDGRRADFGRMNRPRTPRSRKAYGDSKRNPSSAAPGGGFCGGIGHASDFAAQPTLR